MISCFQLNPSFIHQAIIESNYIYVFTCRRLKGELCACSFTNLSIFLQKKHKNQQQQQQKKKNKTENQKVCSHNNEKLILKGLINGSWNIHLIHTLNHRHYTADRGPGQHMLAE